MANISQDELIKRIRDVDLLETIQSRIEQAEHHERVAREWRESAAALQAQLDRRQLEAFWESHPGERLEVGMEVVDAYGGADKSVGKTLRITRINLDSGKAVSVAFGVRTVVSVEECQRMRQAWVEKQAEVE